jgi:hypothetical protein
MLRPDDAAREYNYGLRGFGPPLAGKGSSLAIAPPGLGLTDEFCSNLTLMRSW